MIHPPHTSRLTCACNQVLGFGRVSVWGGGVGGALLRNREKYSIPIQSEKKKGRWLFRLGAEEMKYLFGGGNGGLGLLFCF
jgi:hypothetical protein